MGRKIKIKPITDEKRRNLIFKKRKKGLIKKAMQLSLICKSKIILGIVDSSDKVTLYSSDLNPFEFCNSYFFDPKSDCEIIFNSDYTQIFEKEISEFKNKSKKVTISNDINIDLKQEIEDLGIETNLKLKIEKPKNITKDPIVIENNLKVLDQMNPELAKFLNLEIDQKANIKDLKGLDEVNPELAKFLSMETKSVEKQKNNVPLALQSIKEKLSLKIKIPEKKISNSIEKPNISTKIHIHLSDLVEDAELNQKNSQRSISVSSEIIDKSIDEFVHKFYNNNIEKPNIEVEDKNYIVISPMSPISPVSEEISENKLKDQRIGKIDSEIKKREKYGRVFGGIRQMRAVSVSSLRSESSKTFLENESVSSIDSIHTSQISNSKLREMIKNRKEKMLIEETQGIKKSRYTDLQVEESVSLSMNSVPEKKNVIKIKNDATKLIFNDFENKNSNRNINNQALDSYDSNGDYSLRSYNAGNSADLKAGKNKKSLNNNKRKEISHEEESKEMRSPNSYLSNGQQYLSNSYSVSSNTDQFMSPQSNRSNIIYEMIANNKSQSDENFKVPIPSKNVSDQIKKIAEEGKLGFYSWMINSESDKASHKSDDLLKKKRSNNNIKK